MGKICSKINIFKKKNKLVVPLLSIREKKENLRPIIEITRRYRKKSKKRRSYNK